MRYRRPLPIALLCCLAAVGLWLVARNAAAAPGEHGPCITLVRETSEARIIALGPACDLRSAVRQFPQIDTETGRTLPTRTQLRSIFADNERRATENPGTFSAVRRGCVPSPTKPSDASVEEKESCPNGLVNYYGVASSSVQKSLIYIPKSLVPTTAERFETLGRAACAAVAKADAASAQLPQETAESLRETVHQCDVTLPGSVTAAPDTAKAPAANPGPSVSDLTRQLEETHRVVAQLQTSAHDRTAAESRLMTSAQRSRWIPLLIAVAAALLLGNLLQLLFRQRQRKVVVAQRQVLVDRERLARALSELEAQFEARVDRIRDERDEELNAMRRSSAKLEAELLDGASAAAELMRKDEEERLTQALSGKEEELRQQFEEGTLSMRPGSDLASEDLDRVRKECDRLGRQLQSTEQESSQHLRKLVSLRNRLRMAKSRNAYLEAKLDGTEEKSAVSKRPSLAASGS